MYHALWGRSRWRWAPGRGLAVTTMIDVNQALFAEAREACGATSDEEVVRRALDAVIQDRARSSRDPSYRLVDDSPHECERWRAMYAASPIRSVTADLDEAVLAAAREACGGRPDDAIIRSGLQMLIRKAAYECLMSFGGSERDLSVPDVPRRREPAVPDTLGTSPEARVIAVLRTVFDRDWAIQWLTTAHPDLESRTPLAALLASSQLAGQVLDLLRLDLE